MNYYISDLHIGHTNVLAFDVMYNVGAMLLNYTPRTLEEITGGATCL